mgnify:CR=1 FL=1
MSKIAVTLAIICCYIVRTLATQIQIFNITEAAFTNSLNVVMKRFCVDLSNTTDVFVSHINVCKIKLPSNKLVLLQAISMQMMYYTMVCYEILKSSGNMFCRTKTRKLEFTQDVNK